MMKMPRVLLGLPLLLAVAGCGDDNNTPPQDLSGTADMAVPRDMTMAGTGTITGKVHYAGTKMGTLKFALYDQVPGPMTPPKYFMFPTVTNPTFPYAYTLQNVAAGSYYVVVILDVAPLNMAIPGPEDAVGASMGQVTVTAGGTGMIDVTLPAGGDM